MNLKVLEKQGLTQEEFIKICNESNSMAQALSKTNLHQQTFIKYAKLLNCYKTNQGMRGHKRESYPSKFNINKWNNNEEIKITRTSLRKWIFKLKLLPIKCNKCNLDRWLEHDIPLELNHINGKGHFNIKDNIELLCPNCHALTDTYRGKNIILKYGKTTEKIIDKEQQQKYNKNKIKKPNKYHQYDKTKQQWINERKLFFEKERQNTILLIQNSNIDFSKHGWRIELGKLINKTPQYSGKYIKKHLPKIWNECKKNK